MYRFYAPSTIHSAHCTRITRTLTTIMCTMSMDCTHPPKYSVHHVRIISTPQDTECTVYELYVPLERNWLDRVLILHTLETTLSTQWIDYDYPPWYTLYPVDVCTHPCTLCTEWTHSPEYITCTVYGSFVRSEILGEHSLQIEHIFQETQIILCTSIPNTSLLCVHNVRILRPLQNPVYTVYCLYASSEMYCIHCSRI